MEQLSKEACLQIALDEFVMADQVSEIIALRAMDMHSKQTAIAFKDWLDKRSRMLMDEAGQMPVIIFSKVETTEQLYELFLQSLNQQ